MRKKELIEKVAYLTKEVDSLKRRLPKKEYEVITPGGEQLTVRADGYSYEGGICNLWVHPWDNVASFSNPVIVREL